MSDRAASLGPDAAVADYYGALGVPEDADTARIKAAFHARARATHPDAACARPPPAATPAAAPNAGADFAAVRRAYEVLSNESLRREYDAARAAAARSRRVAVSESLDLDAMAATQLPSGEYEFTRACRCGGRYVLTEQELEAIVAEAEGDAKAKQGGTVTAAVVNVQCDMCSLVVSVSFSVA